METTLAITPELTQKKRTASTRRSPRFLTLRDVSEPFSNQRLAPGDADISSDARPARSASGASLGSVAEGQPVTDDSAWLRRVLEGDQEAAAALIQRLYPTVLKSVRCHIAQHCSEEDLAQAVFTKVFTKLGQFSGLVPLEHWVSRITVNTCLSQLSRERLRPELRMSDLSEDEELVVQHLLSTNDEIPAHQAMDARELLDRLLSILKPEERLIVKLLHLEERSTEEISDLTGWSISRIKVKAFRARNKMRKAWNKLRDSEWRAHSATPKTLQL